MIDKDVVVLSIEEQKCERVANNDVESVVDFAAPYHIIPTKGLFTTYKAGDFGTVKMSNSSYSKIVEIGDVCIKTNVGSTLSTKTKESRINESKKKKKVFHHNFFLKTWTIYFLYLIISLKKNLKN